MIGRQRAARYLRRLGQRKARRKSLAAAGEVPGESALSAARKKGAALAAAYMALAQRKERKYLPL